MAAAPANPFPDAPQLSPRSERMLLAALGLGLVVTVLALSWGGLYARFERAPDSITPASDSALEVQVEVETGRALWVPDDDAL